MPEIKAVRLPCGCSVAIAIEAGTGKGTATPVLCQEHRRALGDVATLSSGLVDVREQLIDAPMSKYRDAALELVRRTLRRAGIANGE